MALRSAPQLASNEADIQLAISSINRVGSALKGVYRSIEYSQRELERIYWLKIRLTSRLLMKSVKEERD
ncbi:hypothetical protein Ptr86124_003746 [Pyrenophora tritici-repentis]|uniref:Uncharacterized protein n=1 Tax=Pyrenophora tritici-repentis TaxID=45151 RepID=A0A922SXZ9_9PLEO|nr:hypothetical protein Ptr86124_003746 [Pyrenophora tritici-repentis]